MILILGILVLFGLFYREWYVTNQVGGARRKGQPCDNINPCSPGLSCFYGVCVVPRNSDDDEFGS